MDGKPIELDRTYALATNDFMAVGGDEYVMFEKYEITGHYQALDEALIAYLEALGTVEAQVEGRIAVKAEAVDVVTVPEPEAPETTPEPDTSVTPEDQVYVVKAGDNLYRIGLRYGVHWRELAAYNKLQNPHLIHPNQRILIPAS